jgi:hypothetical protein
MTPEPEFAYETSDGRKVDGTIDTLRRVVLALLFGSFDMLQAAAACDMLDEETTDASRTRAGDCNECQRGHFRHSRESSRRPRPDAADALDADADDLSGRGIVHWRELDVGAEVDVGELL